MVEREKKPQEQGPQKIISMNNLFELTLPNIGKRITLKILPNGDVQRKKIENLISPDAERLQAENKLGEVTINLISEKIRSKAAKQVPGSEEIEPEMSANSLMFDFGETVKALRKMGYSEKNILKIIKEQSSQINLGETHMGETPMVVRQEEMALGLKVKDYYKRAEESEHRKN